jgi:competence protein ComEC
MRHLVQSWRTELVLLATASGVFAAQLVAVLPSRTISALLLVLAIVVAIVFTRRKNAAPILLVGVIALALGASYTWLRADLRMSDELPREWEGRDIELVGVIDEMPQKSERGVRFAFRVEQLLTRDAQVPQRIALGWYKPSIKEIASEALPELHAGERWRWTVRLKRPHGYANPAGFDLEAWMLERNLRASGSIQIDELAKRIDSNAGTLNDHIERLRERIRERMRRALEGKPFAGVLIALAIGDQQAISNSDWALFYATAVSHLLSISGAHVTLFAAWIALAVLFIWRRSPRLSALLPAQKAAAIAAALVACAYAALTGFAVPAQRTCYMLVVAALALLLSRQLSPWLILCWSAIVVLAIDPWAVLAVGFWFSFVAVALLLYVTQARVQRESGMRVALKTQAAVTFGLAPLSIAFFQQVSLVGPFANAIAIPLITLLVIPLTLLWLVIPIDALLQIAHQLIAWLVELLRWMTTLGDAMWSQHAPPMWTIALAFMGVLWLLSPRLVRHRWLGALWCLPLFTITPSTPPTGEFRMTALDIGQGTAVVIRTAHRTLVYDTGPRWNDETDAGVRLIAPYLRASGSGRIDGLVVSHLDLDHSGGAKSLIEGVPTAWLLTSMFAESEIVATAQRRKLDVFACVAGQRWTWDGVRFEVLHPTQDNYSQAKLKTNDRSCVVKIIGNSGSALLTGDVEAVSEAALVAREGVALKSDVLLIPHHGSLTSSTERFLDAAQPKLALINAGYRNRFGHPREAVLARYAQRNIAVHRTDWHGAITIESQDRFATIHRERDVRQRYWIDRPDIADVRPIE